MLSVTRHWHDPRRHGGELGGEQIVPRLMLDRAIPLDFGFDPPDRGEVREYRLAGIVSIGCHPVDLVADRVAAAPAGCRSILEGIDEILTVNRLGLPPSLRRSLACTNIIENVMGTIRRVCRNVKH
jgi:hypothetical protein